jgi:hypothetical protein
MTRAALKTKPDSLEIQCSVLPSRRLAAAMLRAGASDLGAGSLISPPRYTFANE